jgi:hypothetical protein
MAYNNVSSMSLYSTCYLYYFVELKFHNINIFLPSISVISKELVIVAVSFIDEENHRPVAGHEQFLSHNVLSSSHHLRGRGPGWLNELGRWI